MEINLQGFDMTLVHTYQRAIRDSVCWGMSTDSGTKRVRIVDARTPTVWVGALEAVLYFYGGRLQKNRVSR